MIKIHVLDFTNQLFGMKLWVLEYLESNLIPINQKISENH